MICLTECYTSNCLPIKGSYFPTISGVKYKFPSAVVTFRHPTEPLIFECTHLGNILIHINSQMWFVFMKRPPHLEHWLREDGEKGEWKMHFFLQHHLFKSPLSPINVLRYPTQEMGVENSGDVCEGWYGVGWGLYLLIMPQPSIMKIHS